MPKKLLTIVAMLVTGVGVGRGDVLVPYNNLGANAGYLFGSAHDSYAQSFTTGDFSAFGGTLAVKTIKMNLFINTNRGSDTTFDVGIYLNASSQPGSLVSSGTLFNSTSSNLGTTAGDVYSIDVTANNFVLASNTTYWLRVTRGAYNSSTQDEIDWTTGATGAVGSAKQSSDGGATWSNLGASTDQFGGQIVMVPEPGTMLLGGIAAACGGGGVWWRRRGKAKGAEAVEQPAAV
jgi:hypothetical protein